MNKLKNLIYIYKKTHKRIKLIYFLKYKNQITLIKCKNKSFISNNNNVHNRLYNGFKTKRDNIDKLSQKIYQDEAKKYTYFPEINHYDLIYNNYYIINNVPEVDNRSEKNYIKTEVSNSIKRNNKSYQKNPSCEMNIPYKTINDNQNIINPKSKTSRENNITNKKMYFNSIIKKNKPLLNELEGEEERKKDNKVTSKIIHYKNKIPNNYKKYNSKTIKNRKPKQIHQNKEPKRNNLTNNNNNQKTNEINNDLTSFYSSPITLNEINNIINKKSNQNSEIINIGKSKSHSYYAQTTKNTIKNTKSNNKNRIILSPYSNRNNNYILKKDLKTLEIKDYNDIKKKKSNSYKFLPQNECSLIFEAKKNKTNLKLNNIYDNKKLNISQNRYNCLTSNNYRQLNSIGLIDNSISTNFVDRQSVNDNFTLSGNDIIQQSLIYNKANKNISYTFPSKGNNNISIYNKDLNNNVYLKKTKTKVGKKNNLKIFNRIIIDRNLGNITSNTINTDSSSKNPKMNNNDNYKEQFINFNFLNELMDKKPKNNNNLKITSGEVNENVNQERNMHEKANSISQKSDTITMQSMSDSKIMEITNYYLNDEETVDRIKIGDILTTKNNKSNYNIK